MEKTRLVTLTDGTGMGDVVLIFNTNAPTEELKELEKVSNSVYLNGGEAEDVPIWSGVLRDRGYLFECVDEHRHVTAFGTSSEWLKEKYSFITEHYCIENQPSV